MGIGIEEDNLMRPDRHNALYHFLKGVVGYPFDPCNFTHGLPELVLLNPSTEMGLFGALYINLTIK